VVSVLPVLQVRNLSKSFAGIKALDAVQLTLHKGQVHALMGENGAGKSTFMKILIGLLTPDAGEVVFENEVLLKTNVAEMRKRGIAMIHQEILAVPDLTVAQNIFLGRETNHRFWLNDAALNQQADSLLTSMGLTIGATTKMKHLSVAEMQMVEIAKAISNQAKVIIMDEPTSALSDREVATLFGIVQELKKRGVAIVYISHKMNEIYTIADCITVLRDGCYIGTYPTLELPQNQLIALMVGRQIEALYPASGEPISVSTEAVLVVKSLSKKGKFEDINFEVKGGEVLGIAGLMGAGRTEVARAIYGLDSFDSGEIWLNGRKLTSKTPKQTVENGIGYVSEDRKGWGFVPKLSIKHNLSLTHLPHQNGWINASAETALAQNMATDLRIKATNLNQEVRYLSGGNQQKVVLGRVLLATPKVVILDEPTRGVDVGAKFEIYKLIEQLKAKGVAIVMISSELPEILGMSDRILVLSKGQQTALLTKQEATQEKIMQHAFLNGQWSSLS
jgi:inositol transport system ATP-binding protein